MIHKLRDFYLLDGKLLYASHDFIGFDPTLSKALIYERPEKSDTGVAFGTKVTVDEFKMSGTLFTVILTYFLGSGPIRGYKRIEVIENGRTIIRYETGGKGFGSVYSEGNNFLVKGSDAYVVADGNAMRNFRTDVSYQGLV